LLEAGGESPRKGRAYDLRNVASRGSDDNDGSFESYDFEQRIYVKVVRKWMCRKVLYGQYAQVL
jgi:hypothetical protein